MSWSHRSLSKMYVRTPLGTESSEKRISEHIASQVTPEISSKSYLEAEEAAQLEMRWKERQRETIEKRADLKL